MGEAFAGKAVGKKAMLWGILAHSIPDIDFVASFWLDTQSNLLAHRGFTHSILFVLLLAPLIALLVNKLHKTHNISFIRWLIFIGSVMLAHDFLDAFNNYAVGWFEPFSHARISFNILYVVDPFFSIIPSLSLLLLILFKQQNTLRKKVWQIGLIVPFLYLFYASANKLYVTTQTKKILASQNISYNKLLITPAPLQTWLWFVAAGNDTGFYTGYRSVFDSKNKIDFHFTPKNDSLKKLITAPEKLNKLIVFSQQFYTLEKRKDSLIIYDLRFGQIIGWQDNAEQFAFYFYLQPDIDNTLVVQRGRFAKWDKKSFGTLLQRIKGN